MARALIAIVGETATGKTAVGEAVARAIQGEVVCADARQVFRELEIGTGRPTPAERAALPHHLFDRWGLGDAVTAGAWARAAAAVCEDAFARGATPVLVGGSGLYLEALRVGLHPEPPRDPALRAALIAEAEAVGIEALHARLATLDPTTAATLAPRDRQRVLRALEVVTVGGHPLAWWRSRPREVPLVADWVTHRLTCSPEVLAARIATRTTAMWDAGLLAETRALVEGGQGPALRRLAAIGYDEALAVLDGRSSQDEATTRMNERTRQMAKRQRTWFRHHAPGRTHSADAPEAGEDIARLIVAEHGAAARGSG
ncbi:MAG: tRNA (adenosine(37)-N6)-dimethylallyltransferase MiaA [bacterium]